MELNPSQNVVLFGAGFTKNFGGFLAKDMWYQILNMPAVQNAPKLRQAMMSDDDCDYEAVIHSIEIGDYSSEEKQKFFSAVEEVYKYLDDATMDYCENDRQSKGISLRGVSSLISGIFSEGGGKMHFLFTLNQDLFLERQFNYHSPFVPLVGNWNLHAMSRFMDSHCVTLPTVEELENKKKNFANFGSYNYIKLHGSYGWISHTGDRRMVLGRNKIDQIDAEPVLKFYNEMLAQVLSHENRRLIVIGYRFADEHINRIIVDACKNHGLKLYLITPTESPEMKRRLRNIDPVLVDAICGHTPNTLKDLFPYGADQFPSLRPILRSVGSMR